MANIMSDICGTGRPIKFMTDTQVYISGNHI